MHGISSHSATTSAHALGPTETYWMLLFFYFTSCTRLHASLCCRCRLNRQRLHPLKKFTVAASTPKNCTPAFWFTLAFSKILVYISSCIYVRHFLWLNSFSTAFRCISKPFRLCCFSSKCLGGVWVFTPCYILSRGAKPFLSSCSCKELSYEMSLIILA